MRQRRLSLYGILPAVAVSALLAACASAPSGEAGHHAPAMQHYPLALGEITTGGIPRDRAMPQYPPGLLDARLPPQEVKAALMMDTAGKVSEVRIEGEDLANPQQRQFDDAVRTAVMHWTFEPLRVSQWAADANGNTHDVASQTRPFSQNYVFRFEWKDGKPVTEASAPPAPEP
jgi:hypothetical protein